MSKLRRMTLLEEAKAGPSRNRSLMSKTVNYLPDGAANDGAKTVRKPQHRLRSLNQTSRTQFVPKNPLNKSALPKQQMAQTTQQTIDQQLRQNEAMMARGINKFTGRTSPPFGPDSTLEVVVVKQQSNESQGSVDNLSPPQKKVDD